MALARSRIIVSGFLALAALVPALAEQSKMHTAGNAQFEIVGFHARSVGYVDDLSRHLVTVSERYLDRSALDFPQRILVSLKPAEFADFEGDYQVRVGERGFVNLDLRWDESLTLPRTCRALSEALLVRYSIFNYGAGALDSLPEWPIAAIGMRTYLSLRPAQSKQLTNWMVPEATPELDKLLQRKWTDPVADANGYLFLMAMEQGGIGRRDIRSLISQNLAGVNIEPAVKAKISLGDPAGESLESEDWWQAAMAQLLAPEEDLMETMEISRLWIEALADLSNTETEDLNLAKLWDERENEALRGLIEARYEILRLRIVRVNPTYYNAARSLGALFETYLIENERHRYIHRLAAFLGDFEDNKRLEEAVDLALAEGG